MHERPRQMPADVVDAMRAQFDDPEFVEVGYVVAQFIGMGQFVHLLGVPNPDVVPLD
jgi:alkylhydroperoxidase family enzyme